MAYEEKNEFMKTYVEPSYTPVHYEYREIIEEEIVKQRSGKVFYFNQTGVVDSLEGMVVALTEVTGKGLFINLDTHATIRIDRIITLFGIPGAAYNEYDAHANACMECNYGEDWE